MGAAAGKPQTGEAAGARAPDQRQRPLRSSDRGRGLIRTYHQPVAVGLVLMLILVVWNQQERARSRDLGLREINQSAHQVSDALEASLQSLVRRGILDADGVRVLLENVVVSTGVTFAVLQVPGSEPIVAGSPPAGFVPAAAHHHGFLAEQFIHVAVVRLQDSPLPYRHRYPGFGSGAGGDQVLELGTAAQLLAVGLKADSYEMHVGEAVARLDSLLVVGAVCIVGLVVAWTLSIRNRDLRASLGQARMRAEHLAELELTARGLAHETRNPLGRVRGLAQRINGDQDLPPAAREAAGVIMEQADRAEAGLGDFLAYARSRPPRLADVATAPLIRRLCFLLEPDFEAAGVALLAEGPGLVIRADAQQLEQILVNLLLNSLQATSAGKSVTIKTSREGEAGRIAVRDEGSGVDPELLADVFKPYVTGRSDGHGLGLAIVRRIAEDHGWSLELRSPLVAGNGGGTEVVLSGLELMNESHAPENPS